MWKYKNLMLIAIGTMAMVLVTDMMQIFHYYPDAVITKAIETVNIIGQMFCVYILIVVLNKHHESFGLKLPFYILIFIKLVSYYGVVAIIRLMRAPGVSPLGNNSAYTTIIAIVGISFIAMYIYLIVSCFRVRNQAIKPYFKLYAWSTICSVFIVTFLQMMRVMHWPLGQNVLFRDFIVSLPVLATIWMLYKFYDKQENYIPGNIISITRELDNVPPGSIGTIIKSHGSNFYDVEFLDDKGNLLNELAISSDDFKHAPVLNLEARVENFGLTE